MIKYGIDLFYGVKVACSLADLLSVGFEPLSQCLKAYAIHICKLLHGIRSGDDVPWFHNFIMLDCKIICFYIGYIVVDRCHGLYGH